jgi:hypothetical protein
LHYCREQDQLLPVSQDYIDEEQGSIKISTLIDSNDVTRNLVIPENIPLEVEGQFFEGFA